MLIRELQRRIDARAAADPTVFGFGYLDGQYPWAYDPAIEQCRDSLFAFLDAVLRRGTPARVLQVGLGRHGGMHHVFRLFAQQVVTVEFDAERIARYCADNPVDAGDVWIPGDAADVAVQAQVAELSGDGFDLVFLDGAHSFEGTLHEWQVYSGMVRAGGTVAIVDGSQDVPTARDAFDVDRLVFEIEKRCLRPSGIELRRAGFEHPICFYEQPGPSSAPRPWSEPVGYVRSPAVSRGDDVGGFALYQRGEDWIAIPQTHRALDWKDLSRGGCAVALRAGSADALTTLVTEFEAAVPVLDRARDALGQKRPGDALRDAQAIANRYPNLHDQLRESLGLCPWSGALLRALGTLALAGDCVREAAALLRRAIEYDLGDQGLLLAVAQLHMLLMDDEPGARGLLTDTKRRVRQVKLQSACHKQLEGNVLWGYPGVLESIHGVLQVGAGQGEEVAAFQLLEIEHQTYIEPDAARFSALESRCRDVGVGQIRTVQAKVGASANVLVGAAAPMVSAPRSNVITLDELAQQGAFDPASHNLLFLDVDGDELEVLRGAVHVLQHVDVICVAVFYEPVVPHAPRPDEIRQFLLELDEPFYLRAHEPGSDARRGDALFRRARRRRRSAR